MFDNEWLNAPIITKETPLEMVEEIHHRIWDYVIENGHKPHTPYINDCAACAYAGADCKNCPITWSFNGRLTGTCYDNGIYSA